MWGSWGRGFRVWGQGYYTCWGYMVCLDEGVAERDVRAGIALLLFELVHHEHELKCQDVSEAKAWRFECCG
jgi:hypothetical protein